MFRRSTVLGRIFGQELVLRGNYPDWDEAVEKTKEHLSGCPYIYFNGYLDGHHPKFFKHNPGLIRYRGGARKLRAAKK